MNTNDGNSIVVIMFSRSDHMKEFHLHQLDYNTRTPTKEIPNKEDSWQAVIVVLKCQVKFEQKKS